MTPVDPVTPVETKDQISEMWRHVLEEGHRTSLSRLPGSHRCTLCEIPFNGVGGVVTRIAGRSSSPQNPHLCNY